MRYPFKSYRYQGPSKLSAQPNSHHGYFEGWYFKQVCDDGRTIAFIPGISLGIDPHAFIQVNDSRKGSDYVRFPIEEAVLGTGDDCLIEIAGNHFSLGRIDLEINSKLGQYQADLNIKDIQQLSPTLYRPGIMGPFSYIPGMECYHGLVSMNHRLSGQLTAAGESVPCSDGRGYIEKDFGTSFPLAWIWFQANSFDDEASVMFSYAHIPWGKRSFPGHLGFVYHRSLAPKALVFGSYARIRLTHVQLSPTPDGTRLLEVHLAGGPTRIEIRARIKDGGDLIAPVRGSMDRIIKESVDGSAEVRIFQKTRLIWEGTSPHCGIEVQGPVEELLLAPFDREK